MTDTRQCRTCDEILPLECFGFETKNGKKYLRYKCTECNSAEIMTRRKMAENRRFNELVMWPAPARAT